MFARLFGCASCSAVPEITPSEAHALRGKARIVDVREPHEWTGELGHIDGAELVPLATLEGVARGWDRGAPIVTVCRSGARSSRAADRLARLGFVDVRNMAGGMMAYHRAGLPAVRS